MDDTAQELAPEPAKRSRKSRASTSTLKAQQRANAEDRQTARELGTPPPKKGRTTKAQVSAEIRLQMLTALNFVGGVQFLVRQARKKNNTAFMALLGKCLVQEDGTGDQAVTFVVQTTNILAAPVAGVLSSPIAGHVTPPRLVAQGGDIVDMEDPAPPEARHG